MTQKDEFFEYLFKWRNQGIEDESWVSEEELAHLQGYLSFIDTTIASTWGGSHDFLGGMSNAKEYLVVGNQHHS